VLTIEGLNRAEGENLVGALSDYQKANSHERKQGNIAKQTRPRKQRTLLYYQILDKAGKQYTKKTLKAATLVKYWKESGSKRNQIK
jgi:hypothetical protein